MQLLLVLGMDSRKVQSSTPPGHEPTSHESTPAHTRHQRPEVVAVVSQPQQATAAQKAARSHGRALLSFASTANSHNHVVVSMVRGQPTPVGESGRLPVSTPARTASRNTKTSNVLITSLTSSSHNLLSKKPKEKPKITGQSGKICCELRVDSNRHGLPRVSPMSTTTRCAPCRRGISLGIPVARWLRRSTDMLT